MCEQVESKAHVEAPRVERIRHVGRLSAEPEVSLLHDIPPVGGYTKLDDEMSNCFTEISKTGDLEKPELAKGSDVMEAMKDSSVSSAVARVTSQLPKDLFAQRSLSMLDEYFDETHPVSLPSQEKLDQARVQSPAAAAKKDQSKTLTNSEAEVLGGVTSRRKALTLDIESSSVVTGDSELGDNSSLCFECASRHSDQHSVTSPTTNTAGVAERLRRMSTSSMRSTKRQISLPGSTPARCRFDPISTSSSGPCSTS